MKKKVGIVTWYKNGNYGGTLQAYALMKTVEELGYQPEFIDYQPGHSAFKSVIRKLKNTVFLLRYPLSSKSRAHIWEFVRSNMPESPLLTSSKELVEYVTSQYDACICGSDQIWSLVGKQEPAYFLSFCPKDKRIAYAPSIGLSEVSDNDREFFKQHVSPIPFLSVREKRGMEIIRELTSREAELVADPCILRTAAQWREFSSKKMNGEEYILCYFIGKNDQYLEIGNNLSQEYGLPLKFVSSKRVKYDRKCGEQVPCDLNSFVSLFDNAKYILTDSYHGLIFSLILEKEFGVFERFSLDDPLNQNSRIYSLLSVLGDEEAIIVDAETADSVLHRLRSLEDINSKLQEFRSKSINYLKKSLSKATSTDL